ncbi:hypothetical protein [Halalkalibacter hemicellulosilyticus]|uniref:Uncharacterized protein n=1 Tax=Halalkalibacter hemicellulosilyticusJCM 9152 TaxID=1236971 RepID=W4QG34_9BACI|nr:hypothetical protein [Halalkalibacter hemicellulosilyticus]GAE31036.1 hypothetical protein JCM9152_2474 [Halalkalibacter hemicellulosilyticusJCM 9152]
MTEHHSHVVKPKLYRVRQREQPLYYSQIRFDRLENKLTSGVEIYHALMDQMDCTDKRITEAERLLARFIGSDGEQLESFLGELRTHYKKQEWIIQQVDVLNESKAEFLKCISDLKEEKVLVHELLSHLQVQLKRNELIVTELEDDLNSRFTKMSLDEVDYDVLRTLLQEYKEKQKGVEIQLKEIAEEVKALILLQRNQERIQLDFYTEFNWLKKQIESSKGLNHQSDNVLKTDE